MLGFLNVADYATIQELKTEIGKETDGKDPVLKMLLTASSRAIDNYCNRKDGFVAVSTASARVYTGSGHTHQWIDECVAVTAVAVKESVTDDSYTAWSTSDWIAASGDPERPDFNRTPYQFLLVNPTGDESHFTHGLFSAWRGFRPEINERGRGAPTVQVTARWGYATTVPDPIKQATIIQAARWFKRAESSWADVITQTDFMMLRFVKSLDADIKFLLEEGRYRKPAIGVR